MLLASIGILLLAAPTVATSQQPARRNVGPNASAHPVTLLNSTRSIEGAVYGFDYEYDDSESEFAGTSALSGAWSSDFDIDLFDYYNTEVGISRAELATDIDANGITFESLGTAVASGNHFDADASAEILTTIEFTVERPVRFLFVASTDSTVGYSRAEVRLRHGDGSVVEQAASGMFLNAPDDVQRFGWLAVGDYSFSLLTYSAAYSTSNQPDYHFASADGALQWFQACDYDLDGDVDRRDLRSFQADCAQGEDEADFNGDGNTDSSDLRAFLRAWRRS